LDVEIYCHYEMRSSEVIFVKKYCVTYSVIPVIKGAFCMPDLLSAYTSTHFNRRKIKQLLSVKEQKKFFNLLGVKLSGFLDEKYILHSILEQLYQAARATIGIILMLEEEKQHFIFYDAIGINLSESSIRNLAWSLKRQYHNLPAGLDKVHLFDVQTFTKRSDFIFEKSIGFRSLYFQPLGMEGQILGAVLLGNRQETINFSQEDVRRVAGVALTAGAQLERIWLYRELQSMVINMIHAFVSTIEAKDKYTCGHSERVTNYSLKMASLLGWKKEIQDVLRMSAILHDIGKIGVPEAILMKSGSLTEWEYSIIKCHPENGAHIVEKVPQFQYVLPGILFHHERYDGKGYPHGLGGQEIPEFGRLIAVADAYDAMTGERPYRKGLQHEQAIQELQANCGKQFDPEMVEVFLQAYHQGVII